MSTDNDGEEINPDILQDALKTGNMSSSLEKKLIAIFDVVFDGDIFTRTKMWKGVAKNELNMDTNGIYNRFWNNDDIFIDVKNEFGFDLLQWGPFCVLICGVDYEYLDKIKQ
jgi:hypothetical protein